MRSFGENFVRKLQVAFLSFVCTSMKYSARVGENIG